MAENLLKEKTIFDAKSQSISNRIAVSLIITVLIVSAIAITAMYYNFSQTGNKELENKANETVTNLAGFLEMPLWNVNKNDIHMIGDAISQDDTVAILIIKDEFNSVVYSVEKKNYNELLSKTKKIYHKQNNADVYAGEVTLAFTKRTYQANNRKLLYSSIMIIVVIIIPIVIMTGYLIRAYLRKPLVSLNEIVTRYSSGIYDMSDHKIPYLEFQPFGVVLVEMADKITEQIQNIRKHKEHLEDLVRERTEELVSAKERAEAASKSKSIFLANMSHELRTPLNAILGFSQLMQRDKSLGTEQHGYLNTINRSGVHLLALINDVLSISKIEAGRVKLESVVIDLPQLFHDVYSMFVVKTEAKNLNFELIGIESLIRYINGDESKLRQMLINLGGNAVKFTDEGGIVIRVDAQKGTRSDLRLVVEVEDTGHGIGEDEIGKVFQAFEQTSSGRTSQSGTGLGLAISRDFARLMGGDITVQSKLVSGTVFRLEVDAQMGDVSECMNEALPRRVVALEPKQKIPRILVVDDREEARFLVSTILNMVGIEVHQAVNGEDAMEKFSELRPDFILMDIRMPVMDGLQATSHIRAMEGGKLTKIVALTASVLEEECDDFIQKGLDDYLRKPFREHEIFDSITKHLGTKFIYESSDTEEIIESDDMLNSEIIVDNIPLELRNELLEAVLRLDTEKTQEIIERIELLDSHIGSALNTLAKNLDFDHLIDLMDVSKAEGGA